jgi:AraC-like DNA-binding protein
MKGVPLTHASAFAPFVGFLSEVGTAVGPLLDKVGLPADVLPGSDALIPLHPLCAFLDTVARTEGLEHLGFLVGQRTAFSDLGSLGQLIVRCFSLHDALHTFIRVHPTYSTDSRFRLVVEGERTWLQGTLDRRLERGWQEIEQFNVVMMIQLVRLTSHSEWRPREVHLRVPRGVGLEKIEPLADARISFGQASTGIEIPSVLLREPLVGTNCGGTTREELEQDLHRTAPATDFAGSVRQAVGTFLRNGYPSAQRTAEAIGMSLRTLQRRLGENGVSYSRLVEEERFRLAGELIRQSRLRITDVAMELGYTDLANFTHAFYRWTGLSPREYRRREGVKISLVGPGSPAPLKAGHA